MEMESLEESIAFSMDCTDNRILPYLPYILQDFWEIGSSPQVMEKLILKYKTDYSHLQVLDLGCGKGAVSILLSSGLKCHCLGIDAIPEFILDAQKKAKEYKVEDLCEFEENDIRKRVETLGTYDIIILGAIGPVFGNYYETLKILSPHLKEDGIILIDDAYLEEENSDQSDVLTKEQLLEEIEKARMQLIEEVKIADLETVKKDYEKELNFIKNRCKELMVKYPDKTEIFSDYIDKQEEEYSVMSNDVICVTLVLKNLP